MLSCMPTSKGVLGTSVRASRLACSASSMSSLFTRHASTGNLFDYRRQNNKKGLMPKEEYGDTNDKDFVVFPRERTGRNYALNWALCKDSIIPKHEAYRNLHVRGSLMRASGYTDAAKALCVDRSAQDEQYSVLFCPLQSDEAEDPMVQVCDPAPKGPRLLSTDQFSELFKKLRTHLSKKDQLFVRDSQAVTAGARNKYRFVCDNAASSMFLGYLLSDVPRSTDPQKFEPDVLALVAPSLKLNNPESVGLKSNNFVAVNLTQRQILVGGTPSFEALQNAVSTLTTFLFASQGTLVLPGDTVCSDSGNLGLIMGSSGDLPNTACLSMNNVNAWSSSGTSRLFSSITHGQGSANRSRGDLVENLPGDKVPVTQPHSAAVSGQPQALFFLSTGSKNKVTKIHTDDAFARLEAATSYVQPLSKQALQEGLQHRITKAEAGTYELSLTKGASEKDMMDLVLSILK